MAPLLTFPEGFLWGAATSAHQVEGENRNTDWWRSEQRGRVPHRSGSACDSWHLYPEDARLLQQIGLSAYRLSVEWARIEPESGWFDQAALDHYRGVLEGLRKAGIEPIVTLHHITNPLWVADRGGWTWAECAPRFAAYADRVGKALGDLVRWWVTVNEPGTTGTFGYLDASWPPHRAGDLVGYLRHMRGCALGHAAARDALRAQRPDALVSIAYALCPLEPFRSGAPLDRLPVRLWRWLWYGGLTPAFARTLDWVGVNYYFRLRMQADPRPWKLFTRVHQGPGEKTDFGWEIHPMGLYQVLRWVGSFGKPVLITENGIADANDDQRAAFIVAHLRQAHRALRAGVDLRGYMHWSLLDNFEWAEGYTKRFGLAAVEFTSPTKERTLRPSAYVYRDIVRANAVADVPDLSARRGSG